MAGHPQVIRQEGAGLRLLRDAIDRQGRYDAGKLARVIDWSRSDMARYLGKDPSTVSRFGASARYQEKLGVLAALVQGLLDVMNDDLAAVRAWLRTPNRALDCEAPRKKILDGDLDRVDALVNEFRSGLAL